MRRTLGFAAVLVGVAALVASTAVIRAGTPEALVAQNHLRQLGAALRSYLSDNGDRLDDPIHMWQFGYVSDTAAFWNPGDAEPQPGAILNSVPNAFNSARISFEFATCLRPCEGILGDEPVIGDNTPDNNGGSFISFLTLDGAIETDPPNTAAVPTNVAITRAHLRRLWGWIHYYAMEHCGTAPTQLLDVFPGPNAMSPRNYWNPGDSDPMPTDITSDEPDAINSARISFDYLVAGQNWDTMDPETIVLSDNTSANNGGAGVSVLNRLGFVRFVTVGVFGDANGDSDLDLGDYAAMPNCFTARDYGAILDNACRIMDWDGNDEVTPWNDQTNFLLTMTGPQSK